VQNNVVLIQNAIYSQSGKYLKLTKVDSNIGAQVLDVTRECNDTDNDIYTVKTIMFNEILPILKLRKVRTALLKVDIESSESFVFQSGDEVFRSVDIPFIMMEWIHVKRFKDRVDLILNFLTAMRYIPTQDGCERLNLTNLISWPTDIFWVRDNYTSALC
jgi:hypothetical protein